jgi:hypothetical protein
MTWEDFPSMIEKLMAQPPRRRRRGTEDKFDGALRQHDLEIVAKN